MDVIDFAYPHNSSNDRESIPSPNKNQQAENMAAAPEKFEGFMISSTDRWSDFKKEKV